jgi:hypothetical protein
MIDINELRLGNWVDNVGDKEYVTALAVNFLATNGQIGIDIEKVYPIPLTPDILEKCGFRYMEELNGLHYKGHVVFKTISGDWIIDIERKGLLINIYTLHQLQNLYFALTGDELQINW